MHIATHVIKIKGNADKNLWTKDKLEKYIRSKIDRVQSFYHANLELFTIDDEVVNVWIFVSALPSEVSKDIICKWLSNHIKEDGITLTNLEIEKKFDLTHPEDVFVTLI